MDFDKDYYAMLGVLPSIEASALRAVYLALQKLYHPDVYRGPKTKAEVRAKSINEAYSVLSDPALRAEYDVVRAKKRNGSASFAEETQSGRDHFSSDNDFGEAWTYIARHFPEAEQLRDALRKVSSALALQFQLTILDKKAARNAQEIADEMQDEYLTRYFGNNVTIQRFALEVLQARRRDVALEINRAISILGNPKDDREAARIVDTVSAQMNFNPKPSPPSPSRASSPPEQDLTKLFLVSTGIIVVFFIVFFVIVRIS